MKNKIQHYFLLRHHFRARIRRSILAKLLIVLVVTAILAIFLVTGFYRLIVFKAILPVQDNAISYIVREIGVPPDTLKALEMAQHLSIYIGINGPDFQWSTDEKHLSLKDFDITGLEKGEQYFDDVKDGIYLVVADQGQWRYFVAFDFTERLNYFKALAVLMAVLLTFLFAAAYLPIRRILRPTKWLMKGVEQVSKGNLNHKVPVKTKDELGELALSFNYMTKRIREMIRSKDQLLLDVSHELRSPLTRIKVALEFLPDDRTKESISEDISEVEKMVAEILETERLNSEHGKLHLKTTDVSEIIKEVFQNYENKAPGVRLTSAQQEVFLKIDADRTKTVLKNILENSIKYSKPEGRPVEISIEDKEKSVIIKIKDYGSGIPEHELTRILEPFYRIDKSRSKDTGGYGLGLSLCKKIMEAHCGAIEINSKLTIGTTVVLRFKK